MINIDQAFISPAKLNLFLHITGRRDDGYHELQTVFQFIDLADYLRFSLRQDTEIKRLTDLGFSAEQDLMVKAAKLLQREANISAGVDISIEKNIPMGGGLGGGSSNAATCLLVLNELWQCGLSKPELADLGLSLGADVPVFIYGHAAWAEGVGEKIQPVNPPENWFLVLSPQIHVSTVKVFTHSALTRNSHTIKIRPLDEEAAWQHCRNDCEAVVRQEYAHIDKALQELSKYAPAKLTGTGACIFAAFADEASAVAAQNKLDTYKDVSSFVVKGVNQSPLHEQMDIA